MKRFWILVLAVQLVICFAGKAVGEVIVSPPPENLDLSACLVWTLFDVNEGDAMLLECGGESMLVDGGPKPFREQLYHALEQRGLTHLTYILSTHFHDDHIDGIYYLFKEYGVTAEEYMHPYSDTQIRTHDLMKRAAAAAQRLGIPLHRLWDGDKLTLGQAHIDVLRCTEFSNQNAKSLVLKVTFGKCTALLCADIIGEAQNWFAQTVPQEMLSSDLIKLPHHGITPAATAFLDAVDPAFALLTTYPDKVTDNSIKQLNNRGIPYLLSGDGQVTCVTDGENWYLYQELGVF